MFVKHGADTTETGSCQNDVTPAKRSALYQYSGNGAATLIKTRFNYDPLSGCLDGSLELEHFGLQQHVFKQIVDTGTHLGGHGYERHITAIFFGQNVFSNQCLLNTLWVGI